jgi:hypothetical protein
LRKEDALSAVIEPLITETVLDLIYPKDEIFIREFWPSGDRIGAKIVCLVPASGGYTVQPIPYVTAENYVRCLSQAGYLLMEHALAHGLLPHLDKTVDQFHSAARRFEIFYHHLAMKFGVLYQRGVPFDLRIEVKNSRRTRQIGQDRILIAFATELTVIRAEMTLVYRA